MINTAIIIGNGKSRDGVDLGRLSKNTTTFGCNALYRDWAADYLCVVDRAMKAELEKNFNQVFGQNNDSFTTLIAANEEEEYEPSLMHGKNPVRPRNNAGMFAIMKAIEMGFERLYLIGFDFLAFDKTQVLSNMYEDTDCYGPETKTNLNDSRRRMEYFGWVLEQNPNVRFDIVFPENLTVYAPNVDNVNLMYYDRLYNEFDLLEQEGDEIANLQISQQGD
jgi:hypothetical protein